MTKADEKQKVSRDGFLSEHVATFVRAIESPTKVHPGYLSTWVPAGRYHKSEKSAEIDRQIERIKPYLNWLQEAGETGVDERGLNCSIAFLRAFANSPAPVPMLAIGNDGRPSAYLNTNDVALEAMFDDDSVQYLLTDFSGLSDEYFEEQCTPGGIPPGLMVLIYQHFARNSGKQRHSSSEDV